MTKKQGYKRGDIRLNDIKIISENGENRILLNGRALSDVRDFEFSQTKEETVFRVSVVVGKSDAAIEKPKTPNAPKIAPKTNQQLKAIKENLGYHMVKHNLNQKELADSLGVSKQAVSHWQNGKSIPTWDRLEEMALLFDTTPEALLTLGSADKEPKW